MWYSKPKPPWSLLYSTTKLYDFSLYCISCAILTVIYCARLHSQTLITEWIKQRHASNCNSRVWRLWRAIPKFRSEQERPEKLRGPGQRVKVGPQRQGGFHSESHLYPSCKLKTKKKKEKGHDLLTMTIATPHQPYLLIYKLTTLLLWRIRVLLEYLDLIALLEYIDLLNRYSGGPSWGLLGPFVGPPGAPFRLGPGEKFPSCPPPTPHPQCGRPWIWDKLFLCCYNKYTGSLKRLKMILKMILFY